MKSDYTTNSRYITHTIAFWKVGRIHFLSSGVKGLTRPLKVATLPGAPFLKLRYAHTRQGQLRWHKSAEWLGQASYQATISVTMVTTFMTSWPPFSLGSSSVPWPWCRQPSIRTGQRPAHWGTRAGSFCPARPRWSMRTPELRKPRLLQCTDSRR